MIINIKEVTNMEGDIGVIQEQGDLGIGYNELTEEDKKALENNQSK